MTNTTTARPYEVSLVCEVRRPELRKPGMVAARVGQHHTLRLAHRTLAGALSDRDAALRGEWDVGGDVVVKVTVYRRDERGTRIVRRPVEREVGGRPTPVADPRAEDWIASLAV